MSFVIEVPVEGGGNLSNPPGPKAEAEPTAGTDDTPEVASGDGAEDGANAPVVRAIHCPVDPPVNKEVRLFVPEAYV